MIPVTVTADVTDDRDPNPNCWIDSVTGGDSDDVAITGDLTLELRAERPGKSEGRVYTITVICEDESGNSSESTVTVTVPHDQRNKKK